MRKKTIIESDDDELLLGNKAKKSNGLSKMKEKKWLIILIVGIVSFVIGVGCLLSAFLGLSPKVDNSSLEDSSSTDESEIDYSLLTGEPLTSSELKNAPVYCIQTPNGIDGARPQAGLNEAGVVFEAIAEAGITRFAAIYQNPVSAVIGPIRSLRTYYLDWDVPFDCTVVHAGGADDALAAINSGGYKDLSEDYQYMYRGTYGGRLWNNLFTTATELKNFSETKNYKTSDVKGFARLTPKESDQQRAEELAVEKLDITKPTTEDTSEVEVKIPTINLGFGGWANFNVKYNYDAETNTYLRGYENGTPHDVYNCPTENLGEKNPEDVCTLTQIAPSVVIAMVVQESKAADNYHEDISAVGSGKAYVFQNGTVIEGTWRKSSRTDQIKFLDSKEEEIKLAPGQTFISAVPNYGSVEY